MKKVEVWLNDDEFQRFLKRARSQNLSPYGFLKKVVKEAIL